MVSIHMLMDQHTKEIGMMINNTDKELKCLKMVLSILENINLDRNTGMEL